MMDSTNQVVWDEVFSLLKWLEESEPTEKLEKYEERKKSGSGRCYFPTQKK